MIKYFSQLIGRNQTINQISIPRPFLFANGRFLSQACTPEEQKLVDKLTSRLNTENVQVQDISGGCGAMYEITISSIDFEGKSIVKQHRMVTEILKEDVKEMHGLRILTSIPK